LPSLKVATVLAEPTLATFTAVPAVALEAVVDPSTPIIEISEPTLALPTVV